MLKGIKQQFNILRLFVAGGIEFIKYLGGKKPLQTVMTAVTEESELLA